jgi:hypothetical protein
MEVEEEDPETCPILETVRQVRNQIKTHKGIPQDHPLLASIEYVHLYQFVRQA